ncbi:MAG: ATP-binding protein [Lachnospiraceae bacterium]|nr:ATP-binding protein [Lachnospiraceae bacterium]
MIQRKEYLEKLIAWKDERVIKVITGIRRCGKSTLLTLYQNYLLESGISKEQIISINFEDLEYEDLQNYKSLYNYLISKIDAEKKYYIFLDEIQRVEDFEKAVDSLYIKDNVDIYITGSNAYLLSGELSTLLSGRYVEISMLPFSFSEYCELRTDKDRDLLFADYIKDGSFPYVALLGDNDEKREMYIEGIYNTIILKDIEDRQKRREPDVNKRKVTDLALLKNIARFLANSIGNPISIKSITDYITSSGRKTSQSTVGDYIEALEEAFIFYPVERYDINGKQLLKMNQKIYIVDLAIRRYLVQRSNYDLGFSLENVIFLELLRRGYKVNIGKLGTTEVDFVAKKDNRLVYFQVSASLADESTFKREITPLKNINDNYPKIILTLDRFSLGDYEGIEVMNAVDWLLKN